MKQFLFSLIALWGFAISMPAEAAGRASGAIGYMPGAWRFLLTYFVSGSRESSEVYKDTAGTTTTDVTFKNSRLSGFQFTAGYSYALGARFELGPSLVYKSLTYANQSKSNRLTPAEDYGDSALYSKLVDASLTPMISMTLRF